MKEIAGKATGTAHRDAIFIDKISTDAPDSRTSSEKTVKLQQGR
jgi:hypothetical protein